VLRSSTIGFDVVGGLIYGQAQACGGLESTIRAHPTTHRPRQFPRRLGVAALALTIGTVACLSASAPARADDRYQVRRGDTLSQVAVDHGVTPAALARANGIGNADLIYEGMWLDVPGASSGTGADTPAPGSYTVQPGDTVSGIAAQLGVDPSALVATNGLTDPDSITAGTTLQVPGPVTAAVSNDPGRRTVGASMDRWAAEYGVPADLLKAMTYLESGWQAGVTSSTGAIGIGQLMPDTVRLMQQRIGVPLDPWNADDNARMSAAFLRLLLDETGWDPSRALAAYYQGLGALRARGMLDGTQAYVDDVLALRSSFG
jgi:LysM repeat protein